jgi:glycosyl hydrolase family 38
MSREVAVVAHTHWDREWYRPFESFQSRLIDVMDDVIALLERDRCYTHFLLDGQMAALDDYLAVRPDAAGTVADLASSGRLVLGPWYVLMDEFCVSGETIVRNLQLGLRTAEIYGGSQAVGYLPDMFGHVAQMPQILRQAGLGHAVVWRGVPSSVDRTGFWWVAPDGSTVRAEYLPVGYANGAFLPPDAPSLLRRTQAHEAEVADFLGSASNPLLLLNGGDHHGPQPGMPELLVVANSQQDRYRFRQTSLETYLSAAPTQGLPAWTGELRSGARASILMGVISNRVDVKVAAAIAERTLERLAEPLAALWLLPELWPARPLEQAWLAMIRNSAHDSICACSADEVGRAVLHRYDMATALGSDVVADAVAIAEVATVADAPIVVNPSPRNRSGLIELVLPGSEPPVGAQLLQSAPAATEERIGTGADLARILGELARDGWLGEVGRVDDIKVESGADGVEIDIRQDEACRPSPSVAYASAEAWATAGAARDLPLSVRVHRRASQRVAVIARDVPGYGWAAWEPSILDDHPVHVGARRLDNKLVRVEVDNETGAFSINGLAGFDRLVDGGDDGDTYNYSPPLHDTVVDRPESVEVELVEAGPVRGRLWLRRRYQWPSRVSAGVRVGQEAVEVVTTLELRAGEALVRVTVELDNPCRDHRLRAVFPLPDPADRAVAECAFSTVERADAEGGPHEFPLATFPSRRFVMAGGLTVTHEGLLEYELIDGGSALALTLLRATGVLSKPAPTYRPNAAGPPLALKDAQLLGPRRARYALALHDSDPWALADQAWTPMLVGRGSGTGTLPPTGSRLSVEGAEVSALYRREGHLEIRVFNPSDREAAVRIPGHTGWLVDLRGGELQRWEQGFPLGPWVIATARFDAVSLDAPLG